MQYSRMKSGAQYSPKLAPGTWFRYGSKDVFVSKAWETARNFSDAEAWWARQLTGENSLQDLALSVVDSDAGRSSLELLPLLQELREKRLLEEDVVHNFENESSLVSPSGILRRLGLPRQWMILQGQAGGQTSEVLLPLGVTVILAVFGLIFFRSVSLDRALFLYHDHVLPGVVFSIVFLSLLGSLSGVASWWVQKYASGIEENLSACVDFFGLRVECPRQIPFAFLPPMKAILLAAILLGLIPLFTQILGLFVSDLNLRAQMDVCGLLFLVRQSRPSWAFQWMRRRDQKLWGFVWCGVAALVITIVSSGVFQLWLNAQAMTSIDTIAAIVVTLALIGFVYSCGFEAFKISGFRSGVQSAIAHVIERTLRRRWAPQDLKLLRSELKSSLRLFQGLSDAGFETLILHGSFFRYPKNSRPIKQGSADDRVIVLLEGVADLVRREHLGSEVTVTTLPAPCVVGEVGGLQAGERTSSLVVRSRSAVVWEIPQTAFLLLRAASDPRDADRIREELQYSKILSSSTLWSSLPLELTDQFFLAGQFLRDIAVGRQMPSGGFALALRGIFKLINPGSPPVLLEAGDLGISEKFNRSLPMVGELVCLESGVLFQIDAEQFWAWACRGPIFWIPMEKFSQTGTGHLGVYH